MIFELYLISYLSWIILFIENKWLSYDENLIKFYCPMAFDNKGAFWVQDDEEIGNHTLAQKMINCGNRLKWIQ